MKKRTSDRLNRISKQLFSKHFSQLNSAEKYYIQNYKIINKRLEDVFPMSDAGKPNQKMARAFISRVVDTQYSQMRGKMRMDKAVEKVVNSNWLTSEADRSRMNFLNGLEKKHNKVFQELKEHLTFRKEGEAKKLYQDRYGRFTTFKKSNLVLDALKYDPDLKTFYFRSNKDGKYYQIIIKTSPEDVVISELPYQLEWHQRELLNG